MAAPSSGDGGGGGARDGHGSAGGRGGGGRKRVTFGEPAEAPWAARAPAAAEAAEAAGVRFEPSSRSSTGYKHVYTRPDGRFDTAVRNRGGPLGHPGGWRRQGTFDTAEEAAAAVADAAEAEAAATTEQAAEAARSHERALAEAAAVRFVSVFHAVGVERLMSLSLQLGGSLRSLGQHALCCGLTHKLVGELSLLARVDGRAARLAPSADGLLRLRTVCVAAAQACGEHEVAQARSHLAPTPP